MDGLVNQNKIIKKWHNLFKLIHKNKYFYAKKHWDKLLKFDFPLSLNKLPLLTDVEFNTIINNLINKDFTFYRKISFQLQDVQKLFLDIKAIRLVYINGIFYKDLSCKNLDKFNIKFFRSKIINNYFKPIQANFFLHLIESLSSEYTKIQISKNTILTIPLYFVYISFGNKNSELNNIYYNQHIHILNGAKINIIEHYVSLNNKSHFTGSRLIIKLEDNAQLIHNKFSQENSNSYHIAHNDIKLSNNNYLKSLNFLLGNNVVFHRNSTQLNGTNSEIIINSLTLPTNKEFVSIDSYLEHNVEYCRSYQLHKTITMNTAKSMFDGIIRVAKNANKTDGKLINNNLLLDSMSRIYTKPQLEIYASDVKCSHAATIGCIDDNQVFYLQSRGINKFLAKRMIIFAFSNILIENVENKILKKNILKKINVRLEQDKNDV